MKAWVKDLPKSKVELTVKTDEYDVAAAEKKVLQRAAMHINIPGFRSGKAPLNFIQEKLKKDFIKKETIEILGNDVFRKAIEQENLQVIDQPEIKIENENSCPKFRFNLSVLPKVNLGDYKRALRQLKTGKKIETAKSLAEAQIKASKEKKKQAARTEKLGKQTPKEQEDDLNEKILEALLTTAKFEVPEVLIEHEVESHLMPVREQQIKKLGLNLENYLKIKENKTLDEYKKELQKEAKRVLKLRLILQEIAKVEKRTDLEYIMDKLRRIAGS